jgi:hypothetical protein
MVLKLKKQQRSKWMKSNTLLGFILLFHIVSFGQSDFEKIKDYIPFENTSLATHPIITIKVHVHVIQRYEGNPQNITENNKEYIEKQFEWINGMYSRFSNPTLLPESGKVPFIPDSRIRFRLDTIQFHIDASDWDRIRTVLHMSGGAPWEIDTIDLTRNEIGIKGNIVNRFAPGLDSITVIKSSGNNGVYSLVSKRQKDGVTFLKIQGKLVSQVGDGRLTFFKKHDVNCSQDIWKKYTDSDKNALHVFYTGSSRVKTSFGCGPSPFFLNVSNIDEKQGYAVSLLSGHELGHCLGLNHTNYPQFSDLPKTDKFGWIDCNSINTSNNIMGYNKCRRYLSPLQVGYIHKRYTTDTILIKTTIANEYDTSYNVEVWDDTEWNKAMMVKGDVVVRKRTVLTINSNVNMACGATIYIEKKAKLIIDGATVTNHFGDQWGGVVICKSYERKMRSPKKKEKKGELILKNGGKLLVHYSNGP